MHRNFDLATHTTIAALAQNQKHLLCQHKRYLPYLVNIVNLIGSI